MLASTAATRTAVEFLTLWIESDDKEAIGHIGRILVNHDLPEGAVADVAITIEAAVTALVGQLNLSMFLLQALAEKHGATSDDEIRTKSSELLQRLSIALPE